MGKIDYGPTGSKLLGRELRRLRGTRRIDDIVDLSKSDVFAGRIRSIAAPTLSQLENGISMPTAESLNTLATIYRTSVQRLHDIITAERLAAHVDLPEDEVACRTAWLEAERAGRHLDALAIAHQGDKLAATPAEAIRWQISRARTLEELGMRDAAVLGLMECIDEPRASDAQVREARYLLTTALTMAGRIRLATEQLEALGDPAAEPDPASRLVLLQLRIHLRIVAREFGRDSTEHGLHDALRSIQRARKLEGCDEALTLWLDLQEAVCRELLGNHLVAAAEFAHVQREARRLGTAEIEFAALLNLGALRNKRGHSADAIPALQAAELIAARLAGPDYQFAVHLELALARADEPTLRESHLKRCDRLYSLVHARSSHVLRYEQMRGLKS